MDSKGNPLLYTMMYIVHDDRVIDSFLESDMDHAKNAMRFFVLKEWFDKNDYTKSENIWLTRFPAGSLANDTLHTVTLFDALKIDTRRVDREMCRKYTHGLQLYMHQALKITLQRPPDAAGGISLDVRTIY